MIARMLPTVAFGCCFCFSLSASVSAQTLPPVEAFGRLPEISNLVISPDGRYIAAIQPHAGRPIVLIYTVGAGQKAKPGIVDGQDWIAVDAQWLKSDRLAVEFKHSKTYTLEQGFSHIGPHEDSTYTIYRDVTYAPDGSAAAALTHDQSMLYYNSNSSDIVDRDLDDPNRAFLPLYVGEGKSRLDLLSVNVRTGDSSVFMSGNLNTRDWFMDGHGHVVARVDQSTQPLVDHLKFYDGSDWHDAGDFDASGDKGSGLIGLMDDGRSAAFLNRDQNGFYTLDARSLQSPGSLSTVFGVPNYDVENAIADEWTGRVVGATYEDDRAEYVYFDPTRRALQKGLEIAFPNLSVRAVSADLSMQHLIVAVDGPKQPPSYYYLDRTTHQAVLIGSSYPGLSSADLGAVEPYPYKARDGLDIHAYLTLPPSGEDRNLPLVVLPHGGPEARDLLGFDWLAQFFANRGYAVFQPNFRGSSGYGHKFVEAGHGEWGRKMQDDVTDGVTKLIADGVANPKRICIVGGSYGGYAALAGAAFTPDLYACAISFAGVSDLSKMLQTQISDNGQNSKDVSYWELQLGDDYGQLRTVSPADHADQVKCPVLLMHGENDTTVRIAQSEIMYNALKGAGKDVQFIRFPGADHYFSLADTRVRFLMEAEKFLAAHIGAGATTSGQVAGKKS